MPIITISGLSHRPEPDRRAGIGPRFPTRTVAFEHSCWPVSIAAAVESSYFIRNGYPIKVSEQHLLSCSRSGSCSGGWYYDALRRLASSGAEKSDQHRMTGIGP